MDFFYLSYICHKLRKVHKVLSYPLSIVYYFFLSISLLLFHPIQWVCLNLFGYQAHKTSVDVLQWFLMRSANILGTTFKVKGREYLPIDKPIIYVSNHQSMFDIVSIIWFLRKTHPKFVSKKELGKGIPSVSYNLKHGGSVLIDRNDPKQALPTIKGLGEYIQKYRRSAVIFPEGTRSKTGQPKRFSENGVKMLCKFAPDAYVVPLTINNSWKMFRFGMFPMGLGSAITVEVHEAMKVSDYDFQTLFEKTEQAIVSSIK